MSCTLANGYINISSAILPNSDDESKAAIDRCCKHASTFLRFSRTRSCRITLYTNAIAYVETRQRVSS